MNYSHFIAEKQNKVPQASFLLLFSLQKVPPHPQSPKERKEEKKKAFSADCWETALLLSSSDVISYKRVQGTNSNQKFLVN